MTRIDEKTVEYVAELARIELDTEQKLYYQKQLESILDYMACLEKIEDKLEGLSWEAYAPKSKERPDLVLASHNLDAALANAPKKVGTSFQVPKIFD